MMGITKLSLSLILVALSCLLIFTVELFYILYYRRRLRRAGPTESPEDSKSSRKNLLLYALSLKKSRSRVEPATSPAAAAAEMEETKPPPALTAAEEEECDLEQWRAMCRLGPSRVLYTIREEEDLDSDLEKGFGLGSDKDEGAETPYYTPASSPARDIGS